MDASSPRGRYAPSPTGLIHVGNARTALLKFRAFERIARRKLLVLHRARSLQDLRVPPGNRLEALSGDRRGQHSIRINERWRICFVWKDGDAHQVEIVDYH